MTRSGAVGPQVPVPNAAKAVPPRAEGARADALPAQGGTAAEFSELLSELQGGRAQPLQDSETQSGRAQYRHAVPRDALARQHGYRSEDDAAPEVPNSGVGVEALQLAPAGSGEATPETALPAGELGVGPDAGVTDSALDPKNALAVPQAPAGRPAAPPAIPIEPAVADTPANVRLHVSPGAEARTAAEIAPVAKEQTASREEQLTQPRDAVPGIRPAGVPDAQRPEKPTTAVAGATVVNQETHFVPVRDAANTVRDASRAAKDMGTAASEVAPAPAAEPTPAATNPQPATAVPPRPAQQIADRIVTEASFVETASQVALEPAHSSSTSPVKVLQIQLQPADLGTVTVRLELKQSELEVHVEASRAETADMVRGDKDALSSLLRAAGYSVDPASIRVVEADRSGSMSQAGQQGAQGNPQSAAQSDSGGAQRDAGARQSGAGGHNDTAPRAAERGEGDGTNTPRAGGGLYV
jgi:chemotaxis protein MotD